MNIPAANVDYRGEKRFGDAVTLTLYVVGISAGAVVGLMGLLLAA